MVEVITQIHRHRGPPFFDGFELKRSADPQAGDRFGVLIPLGAPPNSGASGDEGDLPLAPLTDVAVDPLSQHAQIRSQTVTGSGGRCDEVSAGCWGGCNPAAESGGAAAASPSSSASSAMSWRPRCSVRVRTCRRRPSSWASSVVVGSSSLVAASRCRRCGWRGVYRARSLRVADCGSTDLLGRGLLVGRDVGGLVLEVPGHQLHQRRP